MDDHRRPSQARTRANPFHRPSAWSEAVRRAVLSLAGSSGSIVLVVVQWWTRTH
ncbi:hypothetical protein ACFV0O_13270 [Kitasatospora sp. NPDC059577]|uniref:hypothetical protein n=1 Tax=Kitasatospora sp. NPDC059577 TaxID=3346873 RepID=UPI0036ADBF94